MSKKLVPAVGYIRMSSGKQEASPEQQRAEIIKLAKRMGYRIVRWYSDEAISGDATEKRKDFQRMIRDAQNKGDFCAILCWDMSRFGRFDSIEAGRWIHPLREAGVWLVTVAEGEIDWNDFAGRMMYSIQQEGKHQYLIDLSRNVLRGRTAAAKKGKPVTAPPYGYDRIYFDQNGKMVKRVPGGEKFSCPDRWDVKWAPSKNPGEVATIRWMFDEFANSDISLRSLVRELRRKGIKTRRGNLWSQSAVQDKLKHPAYKGTMVFGRRQAGKYHQLDDEGQLEKRKSKGDVRRGSAPILIEDAHEAIVDKETWNRVQKKLRDRAANKHKPRKNGYLLTGVTRCGHCGRAIVGKPARKNGGHRYYYCPGYHVGDCPCHSVRQDQLDDYVLRILKKWILAPNAIEQIKRAVHRRAKKQDGFQATVAALRTRIETLDTKIAKGNENLLLADPEHVDGLSKMLASWKRERNEAQSELEDTIASASGKTAEERADKAIAMLKHFQKLIKSTDLSRVRHVVKEMVESIQIWWEPNGPRYYRVAKGVMTLRSDVGVLDYTNSTGRFDPHSGTGVPSHRRARWRRPVTPR